MAVPYEPGATHAPPYTRYRAASGSQPGEGVLPPAEVGGREVARAFDGGSRADCGHPVGHVEGEPGHASAVVPGDDVGVAPGAVHVGRIHHETRAVDKDPAAPDLLDAAGEG